MGRMAKGREWPRDAVGRKSRRVEGGPYRLGLSAPDLSRSVDVPPLRVWRPENDDILGDATRTHGSNPARSSQQSGTRFPAPRFSPYRLLGPHRPIAVSPCRRVAVSPHRRVGPTLLTKQRRFGLRDDALVSQEVVGDDVVHLFDLVEQAVGQGDEFVGLENAAWALFGFQEERIPI
jgi:hypothetical protein